MHELKDKNHISCPLAKLNILCNESHGEDGNGGNIPQHNKRYIWKKISGVILNGGKTQTFPPKFRNMTRVSTLCKPFQYSA